MGGPQPREGTNVHRKCVHNATIDDTERIHEKSGVLVRKMEVVVGSLKTRALDNVHK